MFETGVVTNAGKNLLTEWLAGKTLHIEYATGGTGTVAVEALMAQTALANEKQMLSFIRSEKIEGGIRLMVPIMAPETGYTLNQLGIWGYLAEGFRSMGDGEPTLIALYQDATGITIPSLSSMPDFIYTFYCIIEMSNTGELEVTIDTSALVSVSMLIEEIYNHNLDAEAHPALLSAFSESLGTAAFKDAGEANGVAELDSSGKVLSTQLPSYVDDVLEYASLSNFPATGETGKIYVAKDTNKTYRWSGSGYVEISASLALGDTSSTAFRGDWGTTAYNHSQISQGNPHGTTPEDIGASEISILATATLSAASWSGSDAPYSYTYNNSNIKASSPVELLPGASITAVQLEALQGANIIGGSQIAGSVTLLAYGDKPSTDIPVQFIIRGDL